MAEKKTLRVRLKQPFATKAAADKRAELVKKKGIPSVVVKTDSGYAVQIGAFSVFKNAEKRMKQANAAGFESYIIMPMEPVGADKVYSMMQPYIDSKTAHKDFVKEYNKMMDAIQGDHSKISMSNAWCSEFVDLMFYKASYLDLIGYGKTAKNLMDNAKKRRTWKAGSDDIKYGDVVIYMDDHGEPNHTEFALDSHHFISGNYSGGVHKRYRKSLKTVRGRIRPKYPNK